MGETLVLSLYADNKRPNQKQFVSIMWFHDSDGQHSSELHYTYFTVADITDIVDIADIADIVDIADIAD